MHEHLGYTPEDHIRRHHIPHKRGADTGMNKARWRNPMDKITALFYSYG